MTSASSLDREEACPPSAVLTPRAEETSEVAEIGNDIHEYLRRIGLDPSSKEIALSCVPKNLQHRCKQIDTESLFADMTIAGCEEAYTIDAATGSIVYLGRDIHRQYSAVMRKVYKRDLLPTEIPVTLDVEAIRKDGCPIALDHKSGQKNAPASDMLQMICQAYVLAVKYDSMEAEVRVHYIGDNGESDVDKHTFQRMELDDLPARLMKIYESIEAVRGQENPTVYPGKHCTYCPALRGCPAQRAIVKAFVDLTPEKLEQSVALMTLGEVGQLKMKISHLEKMLEKAKDLANAVIKREGKIPAEKDGYVYKVTESSKPYMPVDLVRGKIYQLGGTEEDIVQITRKSRFPVIRRMKDNESDQ